MTTRFTATTAPQLTAELADIASGGDAAANTAYFIAVTSALSVDDLTITLKAGSTVELDGPGFIVADDGTALIVAAPVTLNLPYTGDVVISGGALSVDPVTVTGGIQGGGVFSGSITGDTASDSVLNGGSITNDSGDAIHLTGGSLVNEGGAALSGAADGVIFDQAATVTNGGSIEGGSVALSLDGDSTLVNSGGGLISGGTEAVILYASGTISNAGTLAASTGDAVYLGAGMLSNAGSGAVISTGGFDAVEIAAGGTVTNDALIVSTDQDGVYLDAGGDIDNGLVVSSATIKGGAAGVQIDGGGQVDNQGIISATGASSAGSTVAGVLLSGGGVVINGAIAATSTVAASIAGADWGVLAVSGNASVANNGTIAGGTAVELDAGGTVYNGVTAGGVISGVAFGVRIVGSGTTAGVTNHGAISGGIGVDFFDATQGDATGTVVDGGVIASTNGAAGTAIRFGIGAETLVLSSGFAITGFVQGGLGATDQTVVELGSAVTATFSTLFAGSGTVAGGFAFTNITGIKIDSGGTATFRGTESTATLQVGGSAVVSGALFATTLSDDAGTLSVTSGATLELLTAAGRSNTIAIGRGGTLQLDSAAGFGSGQGTASYLGDRITGFAAGAMIDLRDVSFATATVQSYSAATGVVQVGDGTNVADLTFAATAGLPASLALMDDGTGGTLLETVACYCAGTLIAIPGGELAVEKLAVGDLVLTAGDGPAPIRWIGRRSYAGRFLTGRRHLLPIRIEASALDVGVPRRDLHVSPKHAMFLDGLLIPAEVLINGVSIIQMNRVASVEYFHIELDQHDVIVAEGALSESFIDDDNRHIFQNAQDHAALFPDHRRRPALYCAPRVEHGQEVETIRRRINRRAGLDHIDTRRSARYSDGPYAARRVG